MSFDPQTWKTRAQTFWQQLQPWLNRRQSDAAIATYATLSGLTLWPLAEHVIIAGQTGQPFPYTAYLARSTATPLRCAHQRPGPAPLPPPLPPALPPRLLPARRP